MTPLKKKHIQVIILSSAIIAVVLVCTIVGYSLYMQWKNDSNALNYRNSLYKLTADIFRKEVPLTNVDVSIGDNDLFGGIPVFEGAIKNETSKTITSVLIELRFINENGFVVYKDNFYPLGQEGNIYPQRIGKAGTYGIILPGETLRFRHLLRNCPHEVVELISTKRSFAKHGQDGEMKFDYSVAGLSVL